MKEVYRGNEIIESLHQEHLFQYHNWLIKASKKYNSLSGYGEIKISSLKIIEDGKFNIKENIHRDIWMKHDYQNLYPDRIANGNFLMFRGGFEILAFDEECVWSDKTGIKYRDDFIFDVHHVGLNEEDNDYKYKNDVRGLSVTFVVSDKVLHERKQDDIRRTYEFSLIREPDLTFDEFIQREEEQDQEERIERLESWEGFEHEIS